MKQISGNIMESKNQLEITSKDGSLNLSLFKNAQEAEKYVCSVCGLVPNPRIAVEETKCGHIFCNNCFTLSISLNSICPYCKENAKTTSREIYSANKSVCRILEKMEVFCPALCHWEGQWADLEKHLSKCEDAIATCQYFCGHKAHRRSIGDHENNVCENRPATCSYCDTKIMYKDIETHSISCETNDICSNGNTPKRQRCHISFFLEW